MKVLKTNFLRSNIIESSHNIKLLITKYNDSVLLDSGNANDFIYPRSSIKIFQAIPFIKSNAHLKYKLNSKKIALSCASHRGENYHIKELENWISKIKINKKILQCGIHNPLNKKATESLFRLNKKSNQLHNNCAGKHLAMITASLINKYNTSSYLDFNHPHQIEIRKVFEKFTNKKIKKNNFGIDGCSAPQYSFKIKEISTMLNNLFKCYHNKFYYNDEINILINCIINNPNYIGGTDSLDSKIMSIAKKRVFCKGGAEGVFLFVDLKKGITGVIKVIDGNERAIPPLIYKLFKRFNIMNNRELKEFKNYYSFQIVNHANIIVGSIESKI